MSLTSKIIAKLLMLCGISLTCTACYASGYMEYREFTVRGVVTDAESGKPIEGIKISDGSYGAAVDVSLSDENGEFVFLTHASPPTTVTVTAEDIDGAENGGEYAAKAREIKLVNENFAPVGEGGNWEAKATIDFELTIIPKDNENE